MQRAIMLYCIKTCIYWWRNSSLNLWFAIVVKHVSFHNTTQWKGWTNLHSVHESWPYACIPHWTAMTSCHSNALHILTCNNPQEHCKCWSSIRSRSSVHIVSWIRIIWELKRCSFLHFILCKVLCCNNVWQTPAEAWSCCTNTVEVIHNTGCCHAIVKIIKSLLHKCFQGFSKLWSWTNTVSFSYILFWTITFLQQHTTVTRYAYHSQLNFWGTKLPCTKILLSWNKKAMKFK